MKATQSGTENEPKRAIDAKARKEKDAVKAQNKTTRKRYRKMQRDYVEKEAGKPEKQGKI